MSWTLSSSLDENQLLFDKLNIADYACHRGSFVSITMRNLNLFTTNEYWQVCEDGYPLHVCCFLSTYVGPSHHSHLFDLCHCC